MREILFRAKRADNGEWVESDCVMQFKPHPFFQRDMIQLWENGDGWVECDRATSGQFTGLLDKNGKRIFEGDVLNERPPMNKHGFRGFVAWDEDRALWRIVFKDNPEYLAVLGTYSNSYNVIGNIHDNPELLV